MTPLFLLEYGRYVGASEGKLLTIATLFSVYLLGPFFSHLLPLRDSRTLDFSSRPLLFFYL
jgi:hypothetical protein